MPDARFEITVLDRRAVPIPTDGFSIRQNTALWFEGCYYLYADVVPWDNPYHPDTYDTSIHLFKSPDAENWEYVGEVISKGEAGAWTANGIAAPGACVFAGKIYVAYSVRGNRDGSGHRFIGVSVAEAPVGPFREAPELSIVPADVDYSEVSPMLLLDDPLLVATNGEGTGPGDERLYIYYRRSLNVYPGGDALQYDIRGRYLIDRSAGWQEPYCVLTAAKGSVVETADVRWINGRLVMIVLGYATGGMAVYVSSDSQHFIPAEPHLLESYLDIFMPSSCHYLPGFIRDPDGQVRHLTTPGNTDDDGHYTMWVFRISCR